MKQVSRPLILVDPWGHPIRDPVTGGIVGYSDIHDHTLELPVRSARVIWALSPEANGGFQRYRTHPPDETAVFMMDFSLVIGRGIGLGSPALTFWTNTVPPVQADADWTVYKAPAVLKRQIYATLGGGLDGSDYQLRWTVADTQGNSWARTTLCLVARTT
jgi:hypothetical protein